MHVWKHTLLHEHTKQVRSLFKKANKSVDSFYFISTHLHFMLLFLLYFLLSAVSLRSGRSKARRSSPGRENTFLFPSLSRTLLEPTQPPVHWVYELLSSGLRQPRREADHSRLVSRSRIYGSINALSHKSSWRCV